MGKIEEKVMREQRNNFFLVVFNKVTSYRDSKQYEKMYKGIKKQVEIYIYQFSNFFLKKCRKKKEKDNN